jgi:SAM-dependent methyltransferase
VTDNRRLDASDFGEDYYLHHVGRPYQKDEHWLRFFTAIANRIVSTIKPATVLEAGCGRGYLVELLRERGVDARGFDISSWAIANVPEPVKPYCWQASVRDEITGTFDLIICQEVFPHVTVADADLAIANFCRHTKDVLFSSPLTVERNVRRHVNFSSPGHFAQQFALHHFYRDFEFDASVVTPWAVRFRHRRDEAATVIGEYEDRFWAERLGKHLIEQQLADANRRIEDMERSWFWRARRPWAKLTGR